MPAPLHPHGLDGQRPCRPPQRPARRDKLHRRRQPGARDRFAGRRAEGPGRRFHGRRAHRMRLARSVAGPLHKVPKPGSPDRSSTQGGVLVKQPTARSEVARLRRNLPAISSDSPPRDADGFGGRSRGRRPIRRQARGRRRVGEAAAQAIQLRREENLLGAADRPAGRSRARPPAPPPCAPSPAACPHRRTGRRPADRRPSPRKPAARAPLPPANRRPIRRSRRPDRPPEAAASPPGSGRPRPPFRTSPRRRPRPPPPARSGVPQAPRGQPCLRDRGAAGRRCAHASAPCLARAARPRRRGGRLSPAARRLRVA